MPPIATARHPHTLFPANIRLRTFRSNTLRARLGARILKSRFHEPTPGGVPMEHLTSPHSFTKHVSFECASLAYYRQQVRLHRPDCSTVVKSDQTTTNSQICLLGTSIISFSNANTHVPTYTHGLMRTDANTQAQIRFGRPDHPGGDSIPASPNIPGSNPPCSEINDSFGVLAPPC